MSKKYNVAILGSTGAVGQEFLEILEERDFPINELRPLASARSAGKTIKFKGEDVVVQLADENAFEGIDIVLSSAGGSVSKALAPAAVKAGAIVVDNTSAFRMDPDVPLVVPEINADAIKDHKGIIANPNCSTIIMLVPLWPLHKISPIQRIVSATYQAASGAGAEAMQELADQSQDILDGKEPSPKVLPHQAAFNVFSHNSDIDETGYCEEEVKMIRETNKIFNDPNVKVVATTVRVPVMRAHSEALFIEFADEVTEAQVFEALKDAPGVKLVDDREKNYFPMPKDAAGGDDILVGRIRKDPTTQNSIAMFVVGDQIRKGAALNAVQIAESLIELGLVASS